jgi:hypothetical protein
MPLAVELYFIFGISAEILSGSPGISAEVLFRELLYIGVCLFVFPQSWGGDANGFGLAHCSKDLPADVRVYLIVSKCCFTNKILNLYSFYFAAISRECKQCSF